MILGKQRYIESARSTRGLIEAYLISENRFAGTGGPLNDVNPTFEHAAFQHIIKAWYSRRYAI
jgi:hypothetical protein